MPDTIIDSAAESQKKAASEAAAKEAADLAAKEAAAKADPFAKELESLKAEKVKAEALNDEKTKAIQSERTARKAAEAEVERLRQGGSTLTKEEVEKMVQERIAAIQPNADVERIATKAAQEVAQSERRSQLIEQAGKTPAERELIKYHLDNTVKPSGDLATDLSRARLLAAEAVIRQAAKEQGNQHLQDMALASLLGATGSSRPSQEASVPHSSETVSLAKALGIDPNKLPKKS